ncbi:hypothetical protein COU38_02130 [Candidatus Micrarchaeota archaeon CG10_big_fil_rev_8_21_14_0_10_54_18]|nr:MAG: hypothetical protein AUJ15_02230 [Candidatus Micrarchaeota archaeon CG1_02_55_41]PIO02856.1 MAG: hypothetical protein COT57_02165 [Candidatus Micrarchaeota archaeon CG09_land_8_20_14_0_10_55_25]PJD01230.1 MAG: hypothetical protein COU38_02130 [Candidatus Micrarchaeota archaeon CG10_big_fil_rev_8_21_14_0_10_54_18]
MIELLKVSQLIGMDIYTDSADQLGKVYDVIIDLQKGEVVRLTLEPIKATSKDEARKIFREKTILYKSVKAAEKIILVSSSTSVEEEEEPAEPEKPKYGHYSYKRSHSPYK